MSPSAKGCWAWTRRVEGSRGQRCGLACPLWHRGGLLQRKELLELRQLGVQSGETEAQAGGEPKTLLAPASTAPHTSTPTLLPSPGDGPPVPVQQGPVKGTRQCVWGGGTQAQCSGSSGVPQSPHPQLLVLGFLRGVPSCTQLVGGGNLRRLCPPSSRGKGALGAHQSLGLRWRASPLSSAPQLPSVPVLPGERRGQPTFLCARPLPTSAFPNIFPSYQPQAPSPCACKGSGASSPSLSPVWGPRVRTCSARQPAPFPPPGSLLACGHILCPLVSHSGAQVGCPSSPQWGSGTLWSRGREREGPERGRPGGSGGRGAAHPALREGWRTYRKRQPDQICPGPCVS